MLETEQNKYRDISMKAIHGSNFKLIYTDWYIHYGQLKPFGNGIHPVIREFVQDVFKRNLNIDWFDMLQYQQEEKAFKFDHSELINYFQRNFPQNIINLNQVKNDNFTYIYPLEIKATLNAIYDENGFVLNNTQYKWYLKDIIPTEIIEYVKSGKVKILINIIHDPLYDDNSIYRFENQMNEIGINGSNIIFLGGSNFSEYYEKHPDSKVKIYNGHLFIRGYADEINTFPCVGNLGYMCELFEEKDLDSTKIRKHKFLSPNRTMEKLQRAMVGYFALKYDLISEGLFTFLQKISKDRLVDIVKKVYDDTNENIEKYTLQLESMLPYEDDTIELAENQKQSFGVRNNKKEWYSNSYFHLVTETFFGDNVFLSEKIFKPMSNLQPFLVFGDYLTLAELRKLGFKTFEPFIDESYDLEKDPKKRMLLLEKELLKLKNMSIEELHNWYYSITDILLYNQKHLYTFENYECFDEIFEKIKIDYTQKLI
jgi:hypothetical protein